MTHLRTIRSMMSAISDDHILGLLALVERKVGETYGRMSFGQLHMLRQTLQRFFLGAKIVPSSCIDRGVTCGSGALPSFLNR